MQLNISRFDVYRKVPKDLTQPTTTGALISIACIVIMAGLIIAEFVNYLTPEIVTEMYVYDPKYYEEKIPIRISVRLPKVDCQYLGLDIQDSNGRHEVGVVENTHMTPIGVYHQGCLFEASFKVNKVPGSFHISTHGKQWLPDVLDFEHFVQFLVIGDHVFQEGVFLPGSFNPLFAVNQSGPSDHTTHEYLLRIVPSVVNYANSEVIHPFQYTYAYKSSNPQTSHGQRAVPVLWFRYDLAPIMVSYTEKRKPFYHFLTMLFAIVGGTFTVASIIDSVIFTAGEVFAKSELGKET